MRFHVFDVNEEIEVGVQLDPLKVLANGKRDEILEELYSTPVVLFLEPSGHFGKFKISKKIPKQDRNKIKQLGQCRFMESSEFNGVEKLKGKKITIIGCGAQGFHQGLNLRDSGLDITYALLDDEISK